MKNRILNQIKSFVNGGPSQSGTNHITRKMAMAQFNELFPNDFAMKLRGVERPIEFKSSYSLSGKTRYMSATITRDEAMILTGSEYGLSVNNPFATIHFYDEIGQLCLNGSSNGKTYTVLSNELIENII